MSVIINNERFQWAICNARFFSMRTTSWSPSLSRCAGRSTSTSTSSPPTHSTRQVGQIPAPEFSQFTFFCLLFRCWILNCGLGFNQAGQISSPEFRQFVVLPEFISKSWNIFFLKSRNHEILSNVQDHFHLEILN